MYWLTLWKSRSQKSRKRRQAIEDLADRYGRRATNRLLEALCDPDTDVHRTAKVGLDRIDPDWMKTDAGVRAISICLQAANHEHIFVRIHAIDTLAMIGTHEAAGKLLALLNERRPKSVLYAAGAIGDIPDPQIAAIAMDDLCGLLLSEISRDVCDTVIATLEKMGDERAVEALLLTMRKGISAGTTKRCADALRAILLRAAPRVETSHLRELEVLGSLEGQAIDYGGITGETIGGARIVNVPTTRVEIDCSDLNRLAREDLARREAKEA
jgi:HEAT repeat protein